MIELPEALVIAGQIQQTLAGKTIKTGIRNHNPHIFIFPQDRDYLKKKGNQNTDYPYQLGEEYKDELFKELVLGKSIKKCWADGNVIFIEIDANFMLSLGCGGEKILFHETEKTLPKKHQLFIEFEDETYLTVSISGWGEVRLFKSEDLSIHPHAGYQRIDPLSGEFTLEKLNEMISNLPENKKCSAKKFFISDPGLRGIGNGVIQEIFWVAKIHPKREMKSLSKDGINQLYTATVEELQEMVDLGGRDSEKDLFNNPGRYKRRMHSKTLGKPCEVCNSHIKKQAYLGGSVYFCPQCQPFD
jgi:formamidopyrimidine-DNA glycosylase